VGAAGQNAALLQYQGQGTNFSFTGHTAAHWAAAKGHVEVIRWLLAAGAAADAVNHAGSTPLHSAAGNGQVCTRLARGSELGFRPWWRAAERGYLAGCERMGSPTLQTLQDPILLLPWVCFGGGGGGRIQAVPPS
jgi:hypothetical protein